MVDYIITDQNLLQSVNYFLVNQPSFLSDDSSICTWINTSLIISDPENRDSQHSTLQALPPRFVWSTDFCELYKIALASPEVKSHLEYFMKNIYACDHGNVSTATQDLQVILLKAANMSLELKRIKNKRVKIRNGLTLNA